MNSFNTFIKEGKTKTRSQMKNEINKILRTTTSGLFRDESWEPVYAAWSAIEDAGYEVNHISNRYTQDNNGNLDSKIWKYTITGNGIKKPFFGVLTAHGAGTVKDPLSKYDISAYVS